MTVEDAARAVDALWVEHDGHVDWDAARLEDALRELREALGASEEELRRALEAEPVRAADLGNRSPGHR